MDIKEHWEQVQEPHRLHTELQRKHMWSTGPGLITQNSDGYTVQVQPAIKYTVEAIDGTIQTLDMPVLEDIPIVHIGGGGVVMTMPIAKDDEVMLSHCHRPIDTWWQSGGSQNPLDSRDHHISDAFAIPGLWSQAKRKLKNVSTNTFQLRTVSGVDTRDADGRTTTKPHAFIEMEPGGNINVHSTGTWTTDVPQHNYTGDVTITGTLRATEVIATSDNVHLSSHLHKDVVPGGGNTGPPVPGTRVAASTMIACWVIAALLGLDIVLRMIH